MSAPIKMDGKLTSLQLYVGVLTMFEPEEGNLVCQLIAVLASTHRDATTFLAIRWPDWDLQALTCLCEFAWFLEIILDPQSPQATYLREFVIQDLEAAPDDRLKES